MTKGIYDARVALSTVPTADSSMTHVPTTSTEITFDVDSPRSDEIEPETTLNGAPPEGEEGEEGYEVESIIGRKIVKRKGKWYTLYLVKWLGYKEGDATWELMVDLGLASEAVTEYERSQGWDYLFPFTMEKVLIELEQKPPRLSPLELTATVPNTVAFDTSSTEFDSSCYTQNPTSDTKRRKVSEGDESQGAESEGAELVSSSDSGESSDSSSLSESSSDSDEKSDESEETIVNNIEQARLEEIVLRRGFDYQL